MMQDKQKKEIRGLVESLRTLKTLDGSEYQLRYENELEGFSLFKLKFLSILTDRIKKEPYLNDSLKAALKILFIWFGDFRLLAEKNGIDLHKGILLTGPFGCGKTTYFEILRDISQKKFGIKSTRKIGVEVLEDAPKALLRYAQSFKVEEQRRPITWLFEDVGNEDQVNFWGNNKNFMNEIFYLRHENFQKYGMLTHATTNSGKKELESMYDDIVISRFYAMFNFVNIEECPDFRKM